MDRRHVGWTAWKLLADRARLKTWQRPQRLQRSSARRQRNLAPRLRPQANPRRYASPPMCPRRVASGRQLMNDRMTERQKAPRDQGAAPVRPRLPVRASCPAGERAGPVSLPLLVPLRTRALRPLRPSPQTASAGRRAAAVAAQAAGAAKAAAAGGEVPAAAAVAVAVEAAAVEEAAEEAAAVMEAAVGMGRGPRRRRWSTRSCCR